MKVALDRVGKVEMTNFKILKIKKVVGKKFVSSPIGSPEEEGRSCGNNLSGTPHRVHSFWKVRE